MQLPQIVLIANLLSTFYMIGLIWMVQIVHYPLFAKVGAKGFESYQSSHQSLTSLVVGPPMLIEMATAVLLIWYAPLGVSFELNYIGVAILAIVWLSTAFVQVPCHEKLMAGFDEVVHSRLVISNWIRTVGWSARGVIVTWMLVQVLNGRPQ